MSGNKKVYGKGSLKIGSITIDNAKHIVTVGDREVYLTPSEYRILYHLMVTNGMVLSKEDLLQIALNYNENMETCTVVTHISKLRKKLGTARTQIKNIQNFGYKILEA
jgi:two-component system alkaline phosphatase synthesis response regulator PhoP